eukprot:TRINITY_DN4182_c0_g2_i1.p1 TRINITY_DN4182_c0_g2~~TRINITY_DN4182_c0_g2_i1.p1  ORF type:complete len:506 (-),score=50.28 TRINITY_DN4182_c0_g2_i1:133-1650(-)
MLSAINGDVIDDPVFCPKTQLLYERSQITKYIKEYGQCPISKTQLSIFDLMDLKPSKYARSSDSTPIPSLIQMFATEHDSISLQNQDLGKQVKRCREELASLYYERDAAVRVIARLQREKEDLKTRSEEIRQKLSQSKRAKYAAEQSKDTANPRPGITDDVIKEIIAKNEQLSKDRKAKKYLSPTVATMDELQTLQLRDTFPIHKTTQGRILAIDLHPVHKHVVLTGGADHTAQIFDSNANILLDSLVGHTKKVCGAKFINTDVIATCSSDQTCRIWSAQQEGGFQQSVVLKEHEKEVMAIAEHPTGHHFASVSLDGSWCFYDTNTGVCLDRISHEGVEKAGGYSSSQFHPDGNILGAGTRDRTIHLWDMKSGKSAVKFGGHTGAIQHISFSENGVQLATVAEDSVRIWDLRKLKNTRNLRPFEMGGTRCIEFDSSGMYLACGGGELTIYGIKPEWQVVKTISDLPKKGAQVLKMGLDSKVMFVGCADHNLRVYTIKQKSKKRQE